MAREVKRVILFPRYTTLVGPDEFTTPPILVRSFESAQVSHWRGRTVFGSGDTVSLLLEESPDLTEWTTISGGSATMTAGVVAVNEIDLRMDWLRCRITIAGTDDPSATLWVVGNFVPRRT